MIRSEWVEGVIEGVTEQLAEKKREREHEHLTCHEQRDAHQGN